MKPAISISTAKVRLRELAARSGRLVEFNTFGATRRLLQELKSSGVAVSRNAGGSSFYSGSRNLINIPRGQVGVAEGVGRRNALFHEAGHAKVNAGGNMDKFHIEAYKADQAGASLADRMKIGTHGNEMRKQERLANQTAQADMERMGVPKENIAAFRKDMAGSLNTYRAGHHAAPTPPSPKVTAQATAASPTASQPPQPPQTPQTPQTQPTSPFRKKPWLVGGVAAAGAVGVGGYMATRKPEPREFMNIKTRIKELAAKSDAVRELARVSGRLVEFKVKWEKVVKSLPADRAEAIIRTIAGTIRPLKGGFTGNYTPSQQLLTRALYPEKIDNLPEAIVRTKESLRDARIVGEKWSTSSAKRKKDRVAMKRGAKPSFAEARGLDPETEVGIIHGGGESHIRSFLAGKSQGYKLEGDRRTGIQVHPIDAMSGAQLRDRTRFYASRAASQAYDHPAMLTGTVKRKHLVTANNSYEGAVVDPAHINRPKVRPLRQRESRPDGKYWATETASKIGTTEPIRRSM